MLQRNNRGFPFHDQVKSGADALSMRKQVNYLLSNAYGEYAHDIDFSPSLRSIHVLIMICNVDLLIAYAASFLAHYHLSKDELEALLDRILKESEPAIKAAIYA